MIPEISHHTLVQHLTLLIKVDYLPIIKPGFMDISHSIIRIDNITSALLHDQLQNVRGNSLLPEHDHLRQISELVFGPAHATLPRGVGFGVVDATFGETFGLVDG